MPALLGGHVQFGVVEAPSSLPHIKAKTIKPLAIFSTKRHPNLPDVPTFIEEGYPDVVTYTYFVLFAPAKTPAAIIAKLENAARVTMEDKEVQQKILKGDNNRGFHRDQRDSGLCRTGGERNGRISSRNQRLISKSNKLRR